jgi:hypothetical protein
LLLMIDRCSFVLCKKLVGLNVAAVSRRLRITMTPFNDRLP